MKAEKAPDTRELRRTAAVERVNVHLTKSSGCNERERVGREEETADGDASQLLIRLLESSFIQIQLLHRPSDNADPLLPEQSGGLIMTHCLINFSEPAAHSLEFYGSFSNSSGALLQRL